MRGFYYVKKEFSKNNSEEKNIPLPQRSTARSAGYDFISPIDVTLAPNESYLVWTDVKAGMQADEVLKIYPRSGLATKKGIVLKNTVGIIDADYFENESNDGNIGIMLWNSSDSVQEIQVGDKIAQGIFERYYIVQNEAEEMNNRAGGFGSTGK